MLWSKTLMTMTDSSHDETDFFLPRHNLSKVGIFLPHYGNLKLDTALLHLLATATKPTLLTT
jgi:hypothetical protein